MRVPPSLAKQLRSYERANPGKLEQLLKSDKGNKAAIVDVARELGISTSDAFALLDGPSKDLMAVIGSVDTGTHAIVAEQTPQAAQALLGHAIAAGTASPTDALRIAQGIAAQEPASIAAPSPAAQTTAPTTQTSSTVSAALDLSAAIGAGQTVDAADALNTAASLADTGAAQQTSVGDIAQDLAAQASTGELSPSVALSAAAELAQVTATPEPGLATLSATATVQIAAGGNVGQIAGQVTAEIAQSILDAGEGNLGAALDLAYRAQRGDIDPTNALFVAGQLALHS